MTDADAAARWVVAPDPGRPEGRTCPHVAEAAPVVGEDGCGRCLAAGWPWVRLLVCLGCGHTGCCDSSRGKHAWAHADETGHPLARSAGEGEDWAWCYVDELYLVPAREAEDGRTAR
ncbi:UBP-type zinc finger domain-containing protein [Streptomyces sp. NPDC048606]|uniref:UBP-type zinc finger domain-containing protein n=1 Tax=Streptomyces sp. NPDC048606 TaxID=3154726 RepID=UPI0034420CFE